MDVVTTGWSNGLCQDYDAKLGRWFANRLGARYQLTEMFQQEKTMTPEQRIKRQLLINADLHAKEGVRIEITEDNVDELYEEAYEDSSIQDCFQEFRSAGVETGITTPYSRHYESQSVATKLDDGSWVGWTYWFGGGKYGEPEEIDWMNEAYVLDCKEEEKLVVVRTFTLKETT